MIKSLALIFTSFPILIFGFYQSYKEIYRQKDLKELYKAFNILKNEISFSYRTLDESFDSISNKINKPIDEIFKNISMHLKSDNDFSFEEIFSNSISETKKNTYLTTQDINELIDLSKTINHLDNTSIITSINIFCSYLETQINELEEISKKNKKTYQALTILSSILIIIILL